MLAWAAILVFGFTILKLILSSSERKKKQAQALKNIQRKIAENERKKLQKEKQ